MVVATMRDGQGLLDPLHYDSDDAVHVHNKAVQVLATLMALPNMMQVKLHPLTSAEILQIMSALLPGCDVHSSNADLILHQTHGQPVHVEEVIYYIASLGAAAHSRLATPGGLMSNFLSAISANSVSHVVLSRIDKLRPPQQLTLKVCSVIGSIVTLDALTEAYPLTFETHADLERSLEADMHQLCEENFLCVDPSAQRSWKWHSAAAQEVAYNIIPFNQRRLLHGRLAQALEKDRCAVTAPLPVIAYHWMESCANVEVVESKRTLNAIRCWKLSAAEVVLKGSNLDAARFMAHSIELNKLLASRTIRMDGCHEDDIVSVCSKALELSTQHNFVAHAYLQQARADMVRSGVCIFNWHLVSSLVLSGRIHLSSATPLQAFVQNQADVSSILSRCMHHCLCAMKFVHVPMPGAQKVAKSHLWRCRACTHVEVECNIRPEPLLTGSERLMAVLLKQQSAAHVMPQDSLCVHPAACASAQCSAGELQLALKSLHILLAACLLGDPNDVDSV